MWSERGGLARVEVVWSGLAVESGVVWVKLRVVGEAVGELRVVGEAVGELRVVDVGRPCDRGRPAAPAGPLLFYLVYGSGGGRGGFYTGSVWCARRGGESRVGILRGVDAAAVQLPGSSRAARRSVVTTELALGGRASCVCCRLL